MTPPPVITALATGAPPRRYSQPEVLAYLQPIFSKARHARVIFDRSGVSCRAMVADESFYQQQRTTRERNERYMLEALPLGEATLRRCLSQADCDPHAVDELIVASCTGVEIPGLDLRLAGRLGLRPDLRRTCVLGMGCYAAFPALLRAREAVAGKPGRRALVLALELCSLHFQFDDSLENLVVSALFGDGAAAALVMAPERSDPCPGPRLLNSATHCDYSTFEHMAFHLTDHGFQMRLSAYVPELLATQIETFVDALLARNALTRAEVNFWGVHPGGGKILDHVQRRLALNDEQMSYSRAVLREHGNMSSPTILFVLDEIQRCGQPRPGQYGVLLAFGPGLTLEGLLVRW